jgi:hypothetical protein
MIQWGYPRRIATQGAGALRQHEAAREPTPRATRTNPWYPLILGLVCLPIAIIGVVGTAIEGFSVSGTPIVGAFVVVCIASLAGVVSLFRDRRNMDPGVAIDDSASVDPSQSWPTVTRDR